MGKKTTAYARKRRLPPGHIVKADRQHWLRTIERLQPFSDEPVVPGISEPTSVNSTAATMLVRQALDDLFNHRAPPQEDTAFELVAHAVDVAHIRAITIEPAPERNPMHADFMEAKAAMHSVRLRRLALGKWGLNGTERAVLATAVDHYETILNSSSPAQMQAAVDIRVEALRKGHVWGPES
jgi:hypothetical protein